MKQSVLIGILLGSVAFAQRPSNPALMVPQTAPELDYVSVPNPFTLPEGDVMSSNATDPTTTMLI